MWVQSVRDERETKVAACAVAADEHGGWWLAKQDVVERRKGLGNLAWVAGVRSEGIGNDEDGERRGADCGLEARKVGEMVAVPIEGKATAMEVYEAVLGVVRVPKPEALETVGESHNVGCDFPSFAVLLVNFGERRANVSERR